MYLSDSLAAQWRASGLPLSELVRRGLDRGSEWRTQLRRVTLREELGHSRPPVIAAAHLSQSRTARMAHASSLSIT